MKISLLLLQLPLFSYTTHVEATYFFERRRRSGKGKGGSRYGYGYAASSPLPIAVATPVVTSTYRSGGGYATSYNNNNKYPKRCSAKECGSMPYDVPPTLCPDQVTTSGLTGVCSRNPQSGRCAWEVQTCPTCGVDADCAKSGGYNNNHHQICSNGYCTPAQCSVDEQCAIDELCEYGRCVPCKCGEPPRAPFLCHDLVGQGDVAGACRRNPTSGQCQYEYSMCKDCNSNDDCYKLEKGICVYGQCESAQCLADDHCAYNEVCSEDYKCVPCDCGHPDRAEFLCHDLIGYGDVAGDCYRDDSSGQCVFEYSDCAACSSNSDCHKVDKGVCKNGQCETAQCLSDDHCAYNEVCSDDHKCVPCDCGHPDRVEFLCHDLIGFGNVAGACYRDDNSGQCVFEYSECEACSNNVDCHKVDKGVCKNGQCETAQCLVDEHCGHDELCLENHCVKCDCGEIQKAEFLCHDKINYGNVPGPCLREKGRCVQEFSTCDVCRSDADCSQVYNGVCRGGTCESAECLLDNQCNDSQVCGAGFCVACDCGTPLRGETKCSDGSLAGPDQCIKQHGKCAWTYTECPVCGVDFQCPYGTKCEYGECVSAALTCKNAYDCPYEAPFCLQGHCSATGCYHNGDCRSNEVCGPKGHCRRKRMGVY